LSLFVSQTAPLGAKWPLLRESWEPDQAPHELGRVPIGRISIANSDSEARAYLHAAIDAAYRAVGELKA